MGKIHYGKIYRRAIAIVLAILLLVCSVTSFSYAQDGGDAPELFDLVLEVKHGRKSLSSSFLGYESDEGLFVPIESLGSILEFVVNVDLDERSARGFVLSEDSPFILDAKNYTLTNKQGTQSFDPAQVIVMDKGRGLGDLYVTPQLLTDLWGMKIRINGLMGVLEISDAYKLPYQIRRQRQVNRSKNLNRRASGLEDAAPISGLIERDNTYKLFSKPALGVMLGTRFVSEQQQFQQNANVMGRNDLLYAEADYNFRVSYDEQEGLALDNSRMRLTRRTDDPEQWPLGIRELQVGDVRPTLPLLIGGVSPSRGVLVTNAPQQKRRNFDQIIVEGTAQPDWEAELYRNNELLDFQNVGDNGEYRFENVQLEFGKNNIRVVLYGPQGQVEERVEEYNISNNLLAPGETIFEASVVDAEQTLLPGGPNLEGRPTGITPHVNIRHGINKHISAFGTVVSKPTQEGDKFFGSMGLNFAALGALGSVEAYVSPDNGTAIDTRIVKNFMGVNVNARAAVMNDFESDLIRFGDNARTMIANASANKTFKLPVGFFGVRLGADVEDRKDGTTFSEYDLTTRYTYKNLNVSNRLRRNLLDGETQNTQGNFDAVYNINSDWRLRSFLNYSVDPVFDLNSVRGELNYKNDLGYSARLNYERQLQSEANLVRAQLGYDFGEFLSRLDLDWSSEEGLATFLRLNFFLSPMHAEGYSMSSQNTATRAGLVSLVYLDKNYNSVYDDGDEPLPFARLNVDGKKTPPANKEGVINFLTAPRVGAVEVTLDETSLDSPFYVSGIPGYTTQLRVATAPKIEYPVIETGIIDGSVALNNEALSGVRVQLLNAAKEIIEQTLSAFDGFFIFEKVRPGDYTVQIDPKYDQIKIPPRSVSVTSQDLFHSGIDLKLLEQADEVSLANTTEQQQKDGEYLNIAI